MTINGIDLLKLRNGEFLQFSTDVLGLVTRTGPAKLNVDKPFKALQEETDQLEILFKTERGSAMTVEIEKLDLRRDNALTGILSVINGYTYHFSEDMRTAALNLQNHLNIFGTNIARDNYQSETATIRNFINDWNTKPELGNAIELLNLNGWKKELDEANEAFGAYYLNRTQELGAAPAQTIKDRRATTSTAYYNLRDMILAYALINNNPPQFVQITGEINALIDQYNALLAGCAAAGNDATDEEVPPVK